MKNILDYSGRGLSSDGLKCLLDGLKHFRGKIKVDLSNKKINGKGIKY